MASLPKYFNCGYVRHASGMNVCSSDLLLGLGFKDGIKI